MSHMSDDRAVLRYTGPGVRIAASANPAPPSVRDGELIVVDGWAAESLVESGAFATVKGADLDAALKAHDASTSGTVDEKRARLAAAIRADQATTSTEPPASADGDTDQEGEQP